jgi:hypothetical protein
MFALRLGWVLTGNRASSTDESGGTARTIDPLWTIPPVELSGSSRTRSSRAWEKPRRAAREERNGGNDLDCRGNPHTELAMGIRCVKNL